MGSALWATALMWNCRARPSTGRNHLSNIFRSPERCGASMIVPNGANAAASGRRVCARPSGGGRASGRRPCARPGRNPRPAPPTWPTMASAAGAPGAPAAACAPTGSGRAPSAARGRPVRPCRPPGTRSACRRRRDYGGKLGGGWGGVAVAKGETGAPTKAPPLSLSRHCCAAARRLHGRAARKSGTGGNENGAVLGFACAQTCAPPSLVKSLAAPARPPSPRRAPPPAAAAPPRTSAGCARSRGRAGRRPRRRPRPRRPRRPRAP